MSLNIVKLSLFFFFQTPGCKLRQLFDIYFHKKIFVIVSVAVKSIQTKCDRILESGHIVGNTLFLIRGLLFGKKELILLILY